MDNPGDMVVGWRCDYGQRFLLELKSATSSYEDASMVRCCVATLNRAAHFLVPLWRAGLDIPMPLTLRGINAGQLSENTVQAGEVALGRVGGLVEYSSAQITANIEPALTIKEAQGHQFACEQIGRGQQDVRITAVDHLTFEATWPSCAHVDWTDVAGYVCRAAGTPCRLPQLGTREKTPCARHAAAGARPRSSFRK